MRPTDYRVEAFGCGIHGRTALVVSLASVERHVPHAYRKIGARRRADATSFAVRHGLDGA